MKRLITIILFTIFFITNCQTTEIILESSVDEDSLQENNANYQHRYISLAVAIYEYSKPIEPECKKVHSIVIKRNIVDALIYFFIGGIYTQRSVYLYCKE